MTLLQSSDPVPGPRDLGADELALETEPLGDSSWTEAVDVRIPGLTILFHPDLRRVGEWASLNALAAGEEQALSRLHPSFHASGETLHRPLGDRHLSRRPIIFRQSRDGAVELDRGTCSTALEIDGCPAPKSTTLTPDQLEKGVVLLFGNRVVLLVHLLDPVSVPGLPTFGLVGEDPGLVCVRQGIRRVADLEVPVLLRGETGTGKELVARAIHRFGSRSSGPLVTVNMAAIPPNLAAAELFGATRGAFTGADHPRKGFFRRADGGTLFLDEIGETPPEVQVLLLRALETGEVQQVGGGRPTRVNVRVISATDRDLEAIDPAHSQPFKTPLLHRLSGFSLHLPPVRARRSDFGRLLAHFLRRELTAVGESHRLEMPHPWLPPALVAEFARYAWPGNVRQLKNVVRQLVITHRGMDRVPACVPLEGMLGSPSRSWRTIPEEETTSVVPFFKPFAGTTPRRPSDIDDQELLAALRNNRWRLQATAKTLGIPRSSLYDRIARNPQIRKASQLEKAEILEARERYQGNVEAMALNLEVSSRALRRRMGQLRV